MGKSSGSGKGAGGFSDRALAAAGITGDSAKTLVAAWKSTFGAALTDVGQIYELAGLQQGQLGKFGELRVNANPYSKSITIDATGAGIQLGRSYRPGEAYHSHLFLRDDIKGRGLGTKILKSQVNAYTKLGIRKISLTAADDGRVVWPKMGFRAEASKMRDLRSGFNTFTRSQGVQFPRMHSVQQIARAEHRGRKLGEQFLRQQGMLHLSIRTSRLKRYLDTKK